MKFDRNQVATIIENEFQDDLYNEISDLVMDMDGSDMDELFDLYVDYAELEQIEKVNVICVEQEEEDTYTVVRGVMDAEVDLAGYIFGGNEDTHLESSVVNLELEFKFIHEEKKNRQFEICIR